MDEALKERAKAFGTDDKESDDDIAKSDDSDWDE